MNQTTSPNDPTPHPPTTDWSPPEQWPSRPESPRDPGDPVRAALAWFLALAVVAYVVLSNMLFTPPHAPGASPLKPGGLDTIIGRYVVGATEVFSRQDPTIGDTLLPQFTESFAQTPAEKIRGAIVAAELSGPDAALQLLDEIDAELADTDLTDDESAEQTLALSASLRSLYTRGADTLTSDQRDALRDTQDWFGELALTHGLNSSDPTRAAAIAPAKRVVVVLFTVVGIAILALVVGVGLFIAAVILYANAKIRRAYAAPAPGGSVYLETYALFMVCFVLVAAFGAMLGSGKTVDPSMLLLWTLLIVPFVPLALGVSWNKHVYAMGWHKGRGVVRETLAGVTGYVAGLPVIAVGVLLTVLLAALIEVIRSVLGLPPAPPASHPVVDEIRSGNKAVILSMYALACVWAPVVEESIFRGALYHHLRARASAIVSALLVAFLFAIIHPQGLVAVPALMSLAVVFALLREWRGSLIAPIVAHALHNGILVTAMVLALT